MPEIQVPPSNVREAAERFQAAMDEVRRASRGIQNELQKLEIYARERSGEVRGHYQHTEGSKAYDDMADRIKALLGGGS